MHKDADTGKSKSVPKGLGKWRCGQCGKSCKVTVQAPTPKTVVAPVAPAEVTLG
jgi:hypothetical protein